MTGKDIELSYVPCRTLDEKAYDLYLSQPSAAGIAKKVVIAPFEDALKNSRRTSFDFGSFELKKSEPRNPSVSWKAVYESVIEFLSIRADDSRAAQFEELRKFEGVGYCILIDSLIDFIEKRVKENESPGSSSLVWPKKQEGLYVRELVIPDRDYSEITGENAAIALGAKRFCSCLEEEVSGAFKDAVKTWFERETGRSMEKLPEKEESPLRRTYKITKGKYLFVALVREDATKYGKIIAEKLIPELELLLAGGTVEGYKTKKEDDEVFVNIKTVNDRLSEERLRKDKLVKPEGRYEIVP